ncbi:MAG: hypothetical protein ACOCXI_08225 [Chloroflexota bacterium]
MWKWQIGFFTVGAVLLLVLAAARDWPAAIESVDVEQTRLNVALAPLSADRPFIQEFQAEHNGLVEVELILARLSEERGGQVIVRLHDEDGRLVADEAWRASSLRHNQILTLRFAPQRASAGQRYTLSLEGTDEPPFSFWGYDADVYAGGALRGPDTSVEDLRLVTRYRLLPADAARIAAAGLWQGSGVLLLALVLVLMPGVLLLLLLRREWESWDAAAWWGVALALGSGVWPLLWYWLTVAGGRWRGWSLAALLIAGWLTALILWWPKKRAPGKRLFYVHIPLALIFLSALALRLLAVRDLSFPPWVDSTRHALITQVMAGDGQIVRDYFPYLPVEQFPYHFGFHTLSAGLLLLGAAALPTLLLVLGQGLNAFVALTVYTAAWLVTRRRTAALTAAFLVAVPFYFPAYYASWGRFTQLTGVLLLPVLLALTWQALRADAPPQRLWWLVALLAAGLALIHFRVFLVYLPFVPLAWLVAGRGRRLQALLAATGLGLLLAGPRLWELFQMTQGTRRGMLTGGLGSYNEFPWAYVTVGWERAFLAAAGLALLLALVPAVRGRLWALFALALAAWSGLVLLLLFYAPASWLINLNSAYIVFFVPLALILGVTAGEVEAWWRQRGPWALPLYAMSGVAIAALSLFGMRQQIDILNPVTRLARTADVAAIAWVDDNVPPQATVAVNSWHWLGSTWAGSDGGAWLLPLTGRATTTPPADYIYNREMVRRVAAFNQAAEAVEDWSDPTAAEWLRDEGVTHIFVGRRGGFFDPAELLRNPALTLLYGYDGVFVFEIDAPAAGG